MSVFFGPKISDFGPKLLFYHMAPNFVNGPFVALGETVHLAPWDRFSTFFRVTAVFIKNRPTRQKVSPYPTVGAPSASNSPSALGTQARRAGEIIAFIFINQASRYGRSLYFSSVILAFRIFAYLSFCLAAS